MRRRSPSEGWDSAIHFHGRRPQPDYSVGFCQAAFTGQQLEKLKPFIGDFLYDSSIQTYFKATSEMYFPFLICEVNCDAGGS